MYLKANSIYIIQKKKKKVCVVCIYKLEIIYIKTFFLRNFGLVMTCCICDFPLSSIPNGLLTAPSDPISFAY